MLIIFDKIGKVPAALSVLSWPVTSQQPSSYIALEEIGDEALQVQFRWSRLRAAIQEALGFKEVLSWLTEQNISNVDVETDCLDLVHAFNSTYEDIFEFGSLLDVCKRIGSSINGFTFAWVRRQANVVAHLLANASTSYAYPKFWSMPLFLHDA
ncbi:hypothetical protein GH714_002926 [Hevea brasiliensis]|uniref:RNase H type-1 domain-containing protein n=1 Tax=Hevea brasiliensis TaxID=3981 RepID=A0A6A6LI07_HEVBR|nr:hypothetical protein GH714_002926 [Hevea brasiliensis]